MWLLKEVRSLYREINLIAFNQPSTADCIALWLVAGSLSYYLKQKICREKSMAKVWATSEVICIIPFVYQL